MCWPVLSVAKSFTPRSTPTGPAWFSRGRAGANSAGQLWRLLPGATDTGVAGQEPAGQLELFLEPNDVKVMKYCDNLTVAPWGHLIVCEDGLGVDFLLGVSPAGEVYKLGRNAQSDSEFAGAAFSPDGTTLFANIQFPRRTFAITGPWR